LTRTTISLSNELPYLETYRQRLLGLPGAALGGADLDFALLAGLRLGLLETLKYVHAERPLPEAFEAWVLEKNGGRLEEARLRRLQRALAGETVGSEVNLDGVAGLTDADLAHWDEHGYVILRGAVSLEQAKAAELAIYAYLGMRPEDPESWYGGKQGHTIWVSLLRHRALWANRLSPRIWKAYAQLWGRADLWVNVDQGGLNPPERPGWPFPGPDLHWDTTLAEPYPGIQGILYLADVAEDQGAFVCIPGFHKHLTSWLAGLKPGEDPRKVILEYEAKPIAASAGDMVIWHHHLPHGASPNRAARPRVAQYLTLYPTRWTHHDRWL
jgi:hypothetical protein